MTGSLEGLAVGTTLAIAGTAVVFAWLERVRPNAGGRALVRRGFWTDLVWYTLVQGQLLGLAIGWAIARLDAWTGASQRPVVGGLPLAAQLALFVVTHDLYAYAFHRLQHRVPWLWRFHAAHHSSEELDWLAGSRSHPIEIVLGQTVEYAPIVLLGATPEILFAKALVDAAWGMFIHANLDVPLGAIGWLVNGPGLPRVHHARAFRGDGANFGTKLALWDRLFGTAAPEAEAPVACGLQEPFPRERGALHELVGLDYVAQVAVAFARPAPIAERPLTGS